MPDSHTSALTDLYRELCPVPDVLYVLPDMDRLRENNSYLGLLYRNIEVHFGADFRLLSSSFFNPVLLLKGLRGRQIIVHHHWLECRNLKDFFNICWKLFWAFWFRQAGIRLVWTVHNAEPHDPVYPGFNRWARRRWARLQDRIHVHCPSAVSLMAGRLNLPEERFRVIPHPTYPVEKMDRMPARRQLARLLDLPELDEGAHLLLAFGYIAPYKGIPELARLFDRHNRTSHLLIAGPVKKGGEAPLKALEDLARDNPRIHLRPHLIPQESLPALFGAADAAVFNYREILTSGGVVLARSFGKAVIAPAKGCLAELSGGDVHLFASPEELGGLLASSGGRRE
ncbi:MAG TPA: hypothetical protein PKV71_18195 [Calditrichia bacterium]|nr:hypothetical protein [Calditrichia bacterium]